MGRLTITPTLLVLAACAAQPGPPPNPAPPPSRSTTSAAVTSPPRTAPVTFIEDDFARAVAEAKASRRPLFIDAWAPWCHTCLSMRAYVFTDEALRPLAKDFVWLSMDTEKPQGEEFVGRFPMNAWPTLWVIDAEAEKATLKWLGSVTATELVSLLEDAVHGGPSGEAGAALVRGNQASAGGQLEKAVREYRAALAAAPPGWPKRGRTVEALVGKLTESKDYPGCVDTAWQEFPGLVPGTSRANVALAGLECAQRAPEASPARARARAMAGVLSSIARDPKEPILADDRSGLFEALADYLEETGASEERRTAASDWAAFLEHEAGSAPTPAARAVFDSHRLLAYVALGTPERAVPMLEQSAKDFPSDYNPPARLARAKLELKRYDEALVSVEHALALGYGPRKLRLFSLKADILAAKGDTQGLATTLQQALDYSKGLSPNERSARDVAALEKRLSTLGAK